MNPEDEPKKKNPPLPPEPPPVRKIKEGVGPVKEKLGSTRTFWRSFKSKFLDFLDNTI